MSYLDVITLEEAKNHLRIDLDFNEDDNSIKRMITAALQLIEKETNHIFYPRDKTYYRSKSMDAILVYDYPINDFPDDIVTLHFSLMHQFKADKIDLNIGYKNKEDIPVALIEAAFQIIDVWFYNHEVDTNTPAIPESAQRILFTYKRGLVT